MKVYFTILLIANLNIIQAQAIELEWEKSFGSASLEDAYDIIQTPDSNMLLVGRGGPLAEVFTDCGENGGYVILKINPVGEILWSKCFGGNNPSKPQAVINSKEGGYIIAGESFASDGDVTGAHGSADFWVIKIDSLGELEWQIAIGGSSYESAKDIIQNSEGDYFVIGNSRSNDGDVPYHHGSEATNDILLAKITSSGELLWAKSYGGDFDDTGQSITQDSLGYYYLAGYAQSTNGDVPDNNGSSDFWILKIDSLGDIIWSKTFGGSESDNGEQVEYYNGNIYLIGETYSNDYDVSGNHGSRDGWLLKITSDGNFIQQKCFGGTGAEKFFDMDIVALNEILLAGIAGSNNGDLTEHFGSGGYTDFWVVKIDTIGNILWQKSLGGSKGDYANSALQLYDESVIATGWSYSLDGYVSENAGSADIWTVKLKVCYNKYFADADGDGFGDARTDSICCTIPLGYISDSTDCNDTNPYIYPGAPELVNGLDDDCNQIADEGLAAADIVNNTISIFPNLVNNMLFIQSDATHHITIVNQLGKELLFANLFIGFNTISVENFASGVYWVKAENGEMVVWVKE